MRIIGQDRDFSVEFERSIIELQGMGVYAEINSKIYCLGAYKSRERAMEVFSEIHNEYRSINAIFQNVDISEEDIKDIMSRLRAEDMVPISDNCVNRKIESVASSVFYMPLS